MLDNDQLKEKLEQSPSQKRLTPDLLKSKIHNASFTVMSGTLTVCLLTMVNGFQVVGKSACADPANYNKEIGEKVAFDDAFRQLWALESYLLREDISKESGYLPNIETRAEQEQKAA